MASTTTDPGRTSARAVSAPAGSAGIQWSDPVVQAFWLLRLGFIAAPILFGLDKFAHVLVNWDIYLAPEFADVLPWTTHQLMYAVGAIEIVAGLVVALRPRFGGYLVAAWLGGIIVNLLMQADYYDIALRDFGLMLGALTLARLASAFTPAGTRV